MFSHKLIVKKTLLPLYLFWKLVENLQAENTYSNIG